VRARKDSRPGVSASPPFYVQDVLSLPRATCGRAGVVARVCIVRRRQRQHRLVVRVSVTVVVRES
jgi:hypothetical protein